MSLPEANNTTTKKSRKTPVREELGFNLKYMPYIIENHCHLDDAGQPTATKLKASVLVKIIEDKFGRPATVKSLRASLKALNIVDSFYKPAAPRKKDKEPPKSATPLTLELLAERVQKLEQTKPKTPPLGKKLRQELDDLDTHVTVTLPEIIQAAIACLRQQERDRRAWLLEFTAKAKASAYDVTELEAVLSKSPEDSFLELEAKLSEFSQLGAATRHKRQRQQQLQFKDDNAVGSQQEPTTGKTV